MSDDLRRALHAWIDRAPLDALQLLHVAITRIDSRTDRVREGLRELVQQTNRSIQ